MKVATFLLVVVLAICIFPPKAAPEPRAGSEYHQYEIMAYSGNDFANYCPEDSRSFGAIDAVQPALCLGYVVGLARGMEYIHNIEAADNPLRVVEGRTNGQLYDIVAKYVKDHPEDRDKSLAFLATMAFVDSAHGR